MIENRLDLKKASFLEMYTFIVPEGDDFVAIIIIKKKNNHFIYKCQACNNMFILE